MITRLGDCRIARSQSGIAISIALEVVSSRRLDCLIAGYVAVFEDVYPAMIDAASRTLHTAAWVFRELTF